jgi:hypothetical protein
MLQKFKENWQHFIQAEPGHRFQDRYDQCQCQRDPKCKFHFGKLVNVAVGIVVTAFGLFMMPAPGPGAPIVLVGLGLIGSEFLPVARFLDRAEVRLRPIVLRVREIALRTWTRTSLPIKAMVGLALLTGAAGAAYIGYEFFLRESMGQQWLKMLIM